MNRRNFLTRLGVLVSTAIVGRALANSGHNMPANTGHNMGHMGGMNSMQGHMGQNKLLPVSALPTGTPLPTLPLLKNTSQQANTFEATLHARPIKVTLTPEITTEFWAYNDSIPGPSIEVFEGDTIKITVKNDLPQPTTVHWHGLPVPADQDGNPQDEIPVGGSRVYTFTLPEGCAGTYWYHPHGHETVAEQAFRGLAGTLIVRAKNDPLVHLPEQQWLFSDLKLNSDGQIADNSMMDWMNGREGQFTLLNGSHQPKITLTEATRVRLWNACSGRYLNLNFPGCDVQLVGTDGGLMEKPYALEILLLSPGERAEVIVTPIQTATAMLQSFAYDRGKMGPKVIEIPRFLAEMGLTESKAPTLPSILRPLPQLGTATASKYLEYTEEMKMGSGMKFYINGKSHDMARIDLVSNAGEVEEWTIFNNSHMDHNFHIHGTQFTVVNYELDGDKRLPDYIGHKDTVNLRPYETVRIKIRQDLKGLRMYHCHILEHETLGMMGQLNVI
ncbi:multicopper oxidase family protein [Zophobihabitans entericus]|uniref:Multicopper oxidase domain-containing protein n=1 Tax=Zophobihabitans entericus TaxID=1635327 RepID=A0A6G9I8T0_9GAMM|nr:multicopper oxidase family protein [Zophobihabitans entericus]QIQ20232.1 multicopper oxidase domain-containing protein [Zophobihabitans entericus]